VLALEDDGSWKDISAEVTEEMERIWKSERGESWRKCMGVSSTMDCNVVAEH